MLVFGKMVPLGLEPVGLTFGSPVLRLRPRSVDETSLQLAGA